MKKKGNLKRKVSHILGVAVTVAMVLTLAAAFSAPVAASPAEKINEWYTFAYPEEGADGDWFYDPSITRVGEITEAIDGTLYVHVQRCVPDATFDIDTGTLTITEFGTSDTGTITADIDGSWDGPETDFVALIMWDFDGSYGTACIRGTLTATNLTFQGSIETLGDGGLPSVTIMISDGFTLFTVTECGFYVAADFDEFSMYGYTNIGASIFKSDDSGHTWEETDYAGGWVADMAASSIDADTLYVTDGHYVYKTDDAGDTWDFVGKDSLETALTGYCGIPACCQLFDEDCCPVCPHPFATDYNCPITSIDVTYDSDDNPFIFIGTREHRSGVDLEPPPNGDGELDCFPGDVLYISEAGYPANWTSLNLPCYGGGGYDAIAVGCAPDWADTKETYVVVSNDDVDGDGDAGDEPGDLQTHVIYTKGTICGWYEFAELLFDCTDPFGSVLASRIGFPDDWEDTETLFVGVVDCGSCVDCFERPEDVWFGCGGDVYMATDGDAIDLNVEGVTTGCQGKEAVDIISLDVEGDTDEARLIAGAFCDAHVYCSEDGGWSWDESTKDPTGERDTYVIWYEDTALAATAGCECAVSMCCGEDYPCEFWNQISLISTDIDCVNWIDHSPGYLSDDSKTMFMITCSDCYGHEEGPCPPTNSVFRHDGTYWERVFCSTVAGADAGTPSYHTFRRVQVSPDFLTTNAVFVWNGCFEMWRSLDAGCSWDKLTFPCAPRPCIREAVVIDEDTVIAGGWCCWLCPCDGAQGKVYKTTRHGARPWDEYEYETTDPGNVISFALEPGYEEPGSVLLGDNKSRVYISEDGGETWDEVGDLTTAFEISTDTHVIFDPGYATNHIIYAATGNIIVRCIIDPDEDWADQEWELLCNALGYASGIQAAGDTALYVADQRPLPDTGVLRSLNPDAEDADDVVFEQLIKELDPEAQLWYLWLTTDVSDEGCTENVLWSLDSYNCWNIWVWEDTLAQPVVLNLPVDEQKLGTTDQATLSWNELCGADCYEVALWRYCAECPDQKLEVDLCLECLPGRTVVCGDPISCWEEESGWCCPCTSDTCIVVEDLEPGTTYYWQIRVCQGKPYLSKWSEERSFITALVAVPFVDLCSPACGSQDIILTPNFAWGAVSGATGYEVQLAPTETFTAGVIKGKTTVNAWVCPETLEYATTYYWRVRAEKDSIYSDWTYCMFTTMPEPVAPTPPVTVEQVPPSPAPVINIPPTKMITPTWIYAIIGVGATLAIVVIVLIVRTRKPPA